MMMCVVWDEKHNVGGVGGRRPQSLNIKCLAFFDYVS